MKTLSFQKSNTRWYERLLFLPLLFVFSLSLYWKPLSYDKIDERFFSIPNMSPLHDLGIRGPTCGLTRSFVNLAHGRIYDGFLANYIGPLLFIVFLTAFIFLGYRFLGGPNKVVFKFSYKAQMFLIFGSLTIFLISWIIRLLYPI